MSSEKTNVETKPSEGDALPDRKEEAKGTPTPAKQDGGGMKHFFVSNLTAKSPLQQLKTDSRVENISLCFGH